MQVAVCPTLGLQGWILNPAVPTLPETGPFTLANPHSANQQVIYLFLLPSRIYNSFYS